jgi:uncharacterized membrane protein
VGGKLTVSGDGFSPEESVSVWLHSTPVLLARVTADAAGHVEAVVTVPTETVAGDHNIVVTGADSGAEGTVEVRVVAAGDLASTGSNVGAIALAALLMVLAGVTVVVARARRGGASA